MMQEVTRYECSYCGQLHRRRWVADEHEKHCEQNIGPEVELGPNDYQVDIDSRELGDGVVRNARVGFDGIRNCQKYLIVSEHFEDTADMFEKIAMCLRRFSATNDDLLKQRREQ